MITLGGAGGLLSPLSSIASLSSKPPSSPVLSSTITPHYNNSNKNNHNKSNQGRRIRNITTCKAELSQEAPIAVAIGACILNSLVFPESPKRDEEDEDGDESPVISSTDARLAVMGIISLIPYFNWLSWVFAWLDTGKQRYLVYALVYLAPYLKTNLSILPEESWLPIASIFFCIIHLQLEISVRNGDLQGFQIFRGYAKNYPVTRKKESHFHGHDSDPEKTEEYKNLPSAQDRSLNDIQGWGVPEKPSSDPEHLNEDGDSTITRKH